LKIIFEKGIAHENIIVTLNVLTIHSPQIAKANDFTIKTLLEILGFATVACN
jgi:hypothetical protein